jgi:SNF2 family DNA or RNA helicase
LESAAKLFYEDFKAEKGWELSKHYLKLSQKLVPIRIACSGGKVPLMEDNEDAEKEIDVDDDDHEKDTEKKRVKREQKFSDFAFTSKLQSLIHELKNIRQKDNTSKCLVFSQFQSTLNWIKDELPKHGFQYRSLSGDMNMSQRAKALRDFQNDPPTTIFLLSMR